MRRDVLPADVKQDPANPASAEAPTPVDPTPAKPVEAPASSDAPAPAAASVKSAEVPAEAKTAKDAPAQADDAGYVPVTGRSRQDVEHMRECEALVSAKTASDYEHVVWAYGVLWALFAAYGMFLWRRSAVLRRDLEEVRQQVARGSS
ncbi:MAG: hypothetical protein ACPG77_15425 [Nannocystaceae bacterium]